MSRTKIEAFDSYEFVTEIPIRISDINYGGHLGNDSVLSIMHEARIRYLANIGFSEKDIKGFGIIMVDSAILYKSEGFYGDVLEVNLTAQNFDKDGFDFYYKIINTKTRKDVAIAKTGIVFYDYEAKKVVEAPNIFIAKIAEIKM